jgi:23S rRNA (adenine2503-C2)-methyltransferase
MPDPLALTSDAFARAMGERSVSRSHALRGYREAYRLGLRDAVGCAVGVPEVSRVVESESPEGIVYKFLTRVPDPDRGTFADSARRLPLANGHAHHDGLDAESVVIPMIGRRGVFTRTLCVSSQIGCAMGCGFCETAQMGLIRSLTPREIVAQWWNARHARASGLGLGVKNVVFMGMGEPLDNWDNVERAIEVLTDHNGPGVAMGNITVSTVGRVDGLARFAEATRRPGWHRLRLAVSLNAPNDEVRSEIMPINRAMPMHALRDAIVAQPRYGAKHVMMEYVLIPGVNDSRGCARDLASFVLGREPFAGPRIAAMINVIPYNPRRDSPWPAPAEGDVARFIGWVEDEGAPVRRRRTKGRDTMAACGQLGSERIRNRRLVGPTIRGDRETSGAPASPVV